MLKNGVFKGKTDSVTQIFKKTGTNKGHAKIFFNCLDTRDYALMRDEVDFFNTTACLVEVLLDREVRRCLIFKDTATLRRLVAPPTHSAENVPVCILLRTSRSRRQILQCSDESYRWVSNQNKAQLANGGKLPLQNSERLLPEYELRRALSVFKHESCILRKATPL